MTDKDIITREHPYQKDMIIYESKILDTNKNRCLCKHCLSHKENAQDCEISHLLFNLALKTGVSTLIKWCPLFKEKK